MNANEIYNLPVSPVVTCPFGLEWSEDNHISLITIQGVHVFEFVPNPMSINLTLKFWRTFIYPSMYSPVKSYQKFVNESIWDLDRDDITTLLLQEALTPEIIDRMQPRARISSISWSPKGLAKPSRSLCAIVTSLGSIEILHKRGGEWFSVWSVTKLWKNLQEQEENINHENIGEKMSQGLWPSFLNRFLGTSTSWSPIFENSQGDASAYLVSAFRGCNIVFCKVEKIGEFAETKEPTIVLTKSLKTDSRIVSLLWIKLSDNKTHLIVIGYSDGRIHAIKVLTNEEKLEEVDFFRYEDKSDRMPITCMKKLRESDGKYVLLATKSSWLVTLDLDENGNCVKKRYSRVPGFSITGLLILREDLAILTTQNARLYSLKIPQNKDIIMELINNDLKTSKVQYLGLASSPNNTILMNLTSPDGIFDHLINREPSTLQIFTLKDEEFDPWNIITKKWISNISLNDNWDCVEALRIRASKEPEKMLPKIPKTLNGNSTINELRIVMWLTLISEVVEKRQLLKGVDKIVGEISEAQPMIFLSAACDHLERLSRKKSLDEYEKRSASFLRMFLEIYLAGEDEDEDMEQDSMEKKDNNGNKNSGTQNEDKTEQNVVSMTKRATTVFRASSHIDTIETESCDLCAEILSELPWTIDTCPLGHKLARCSISLLQITSISYRSCPICARLFHPSLDSLYDEIRCIYCDVPAVYDSRVRNSSIENIVNTWTNLSKLINLQNRPKNIKNMIQSGNGKRRCVMDPQTFAVIVDNENGEDFSITETWQEF